MGNDVSEILEDENTAKLKCKEMGEPEVIGSVM
jgi:hypothetical protein